MNGWQVPARSQVRRNGWNGVKVASRRSRCGPRHCITRRASPQDCVVRIIGGADWRAPVEVL
jgi:hypothetical protein